MNLVVFAFLVKGWLTLDDSEGFVVLKTWLVGWCNERVGGGTIGRLLKRSIGSLRGSFMGNKMCGKRDHGEKCKSAAAGCLHWRPVVAVVHLLSHLITLPSSKAGLTETRFIHLSSNTPKSPILSSL